MKVVVPLRSGGVSAARRRRGGCAFSSSSCLCLDRGRGARASGLLFLFLFLFVVSLGLSFLLRGRWASLSCLARLRLRVARGAFFRQAKLNVAGRSSGLAALLALSLQQCGAQFRF